MMQAAILEAHGESFRLASVSRPTPAFGEVFVRIAASSVNPLDTKIHAGAAAHARYPLPSILGLDLAGTVEAGTLRPRVDARRFSLETVAEAYAAVERGAPDGKAVVELAA